MAKNKNNKEKVKTKVKKVKQTNLEAAEEIVPKKK